MAYKEPKKPSKKRLGLVWGFTISFIFLAIYIGFSMLYMSDNTDTLRTVFIEKSHYNSAVGTEQAQELKLLSQKEAVSVLSHTEDQLLHDIVSRISGSIESAGFQIYQQVKEESLQDEKTVEEESTSPPPADLTSTASGPVESSLTNMVNHIRSSLGLQALLSNPVLNNIARSRSQDMIDRGYFSHSTPEGKNIGIILQENGIMYACCAENLSQASPPSWGSPEAILNLWMGSGLHRENLLNPHFGQMGIGVVDAGGRRVVTLVLMNR